MKQVINHSSRCLLIKDIYWHAAGGHSAHPVQLDIRIRNGYVTETGQKLIQHNDERLIRGNGLHASAGWICLNTLLTDPGNEYKDTFDNTCQAGIAGGFTKLVLMPNTEPQVEQAAVIKHLQQRNSAQSIKIDLVAAATKGLAGKELTQMMDLHAAGAVGFTDGPQPQTTPDVTAKILQYLLPLNIPYFYTPVVQGQLGLGQMHEGEVSTRMGLPGNATVSEELALHQLIGLLRYTGGKAHCNSISSAAGVELVRQAQQEGLSITADVGVHHLYFDHTALRNYDTNLKLMPPLRTPADKAALWAGLEDGTLCAITSTHVPQDPESKQLEFDLAEFGALGLETAFAQANTTAPNKLSMLLQKFIIGPRKVLDEPVPRLSVGAGVDFTLFNPTISWQPQAQTMHTEAKNCPVLGHNLQGRAVGTINETCVNIVADHKDILK
jgi:dihydroorotase